jgi:hypothetical protein
VEGQPTEDILAQPNLATLITGHSHLPAGATPTDIALLSAKDCVEPTSYRDPLTSAQAPDLQAAMQQEYDFLMDNGTWEPVDLPADRTVVDNMWIYNIKSDTEGEVSRLNALFVTKGCSQRAGLDYTETFSPVIRMASLRVFLAIVVVMDLDHCQLDIETAFLYAPINEDVHIRQPLGFSDGTKKVCHLKRYLYGLKQPPREFNMLLREWLVNTGWQQ